MMQRLVPSSLIAGLLLAALPAVKALALELPVRKAGLWELKMLRAGSATPEMTMQQCTDESTDKQMTATFSPMAKQNCSRNDTLQTATGYTTDSVCSFNGTTMTSHSDITGDFNAAYTVKVSSHNDKPPAGAPADSTMTLQARWLGPCTPEQRPGDIVMPGGFKLNIKDMDKLKGLLPAK
jgi:Protein of unknown function (DUF3617)